LRNLRDLELIFGLLPTSLLADSTGQLFCTRPVNPELSKLALSVAVMLCDYIDFICGIKKREIVTEDKN
jgi:hypothetical protein